MHTSLRTLSLCVLGATLLTLSATASADTLSVNKTCTTPQRNLSKGMKGTDILELQKALKFEGFLTDEPSGYFGAKTMLAVKQWQKKNGLTTATGYFGNMSRTAWMQHCMQPQATNNASKNTGANDGTTRNSPTNSGASQATQTGSPQATLSDTDLMALADNKYVSGEVPLGNKNYVLGSFKKGSVFLCNVPRQDDGGAQAEGPWIHDATNSWNFKNKLTVSGTVAWPNALFTNVVESGTRTLSGNGLPTSHTTGTFPIASSDAVSAYDHNPNSIKSQNLKDSLPANPSYSDTPYCMGMEVGTMLSGVPLFNAFDAGLRDAPANEAQDSCGGHPQMNGQYHYHNLSQCFKDTSVKTVLGYALDGFPITGPTVASDKYLTTEDLDECHGITSEIEIDGVKKVSYHYVLTYDFPYSVSCFRGKPTRTGPGGSMMNQAGGMVQGIGQMIGSMMGGGQNGSQGQNQQMGQGRTPPPEAVSACSGKSTQSSCSFTAPFGTISGVCDTPPGTSALACVPR